MVERGEVRRAGWWPSVGSEPRGNHPVLIMSPGWFNQNHDPIAIPLTSRSPKREYAWEPHLPSTNSWVPIPGIKTVRSSLVRNSVRGLAGSDDLELIGFQLSRLLSPSESTAGIECDRGEVWSVNLSPPGTPPNPVNIVVLRYDQRNAMAMALRVINRRNGPAQLEIPIDSCSSLQGKSVSIERVLPLSVPHRFTARIDQLSSTEMETVTDSFLKIVT